MKTTYLCNKSPVQEFFVKQTLTLHRWPLAALLLLANGVLLANLVAGDPKSWSAITWLDIAGEGGAAFLSLLWIGLILNSRPSGRVTRLLVAGLTAIFLAYWQDVLDEVIALPVTVAWDHWLESGAMPLGMILLTLGIYHWHREQQAISAQLRKRERIFREHRRFDALTSLNGAPYLREQLTMELRHREQPVALIMLDLHCDETDDPMSRHVEQLAYETQRLGLQGRVNGSHLTSMHSMDNYYVSKLLPLMAEAQVSAIPNPLINITIQGRHDAYPKRRGLTRVPEMLKYGITVAWGQDCVLDPWYPLGTADMLDVAFMGLHVAQMTSPADMRRCFDMVTTETAKIMGFDDYGLEKGKRASLVVLDAGDPIEAIRLRPERLLVVSKGNVVARRDRQDTALSLPGRPRHVNRRHKR